MSKFALRVIKFVFAYSTPTKLNNFTEATVVLKLQFPCVKKIIKPPFPSQKGFQTPPAAIGTGF
jgi:hypothetical protein